MALAISAFTTVAQDAPGGRPEGGPFGGRPGGPGGPRGEGMRPPMPLIAALDKNNDGVIDAAEIANASAALKALDKNGDGQITRDELMPPRPEGFEGRGPVDVQGAGEGRGPAEGRGPGRGRPGPDRQRPPVE